MPCVTISIHEGNTRRECELTYRNFDSIFMANEADFRGPCISCNNSCDEDISLVVSSVGGSDVRPIWRPAVTFLVSRKGYYEDS